MKILIISPFVPLAGDTGSKIRAGMMIDSLKGHDLYLVAFREAGDAVPEEDLKRVFREHRIFDKPRITALHHFLNHFSLRPMLAARFLGREAAEAVERIIRREAVDSVLVETLLAAGYVRGDGRVYKILDAHNIEHVRAGRRAAVTRGPLKKAYNRLIASRLRRYELKTMRAFDKCLVCSGVDKDILSRSLPAERIEIVPNSVDTAYYSPAAGARRQNRIVFTGTMWYEPNEDAVLYFSREIFPLVRKDAPASEFFIVGDRPSPKVLALAGQPGIHVTGRVDDIRPCLAEAAVFVAPIRMGSGTRLKILGAMAMGIPVVSTPVGCEGLDVRDGIDICIAGTAVEFGDKILRLLKDGAHHSSLAEAARRLVIEKYSRETVGNKISEIWKNIGAEAAGS